MSPPSSGSTLFCPRPRIGHVLPIAPLPAQLEAQHVPLALVGAAILLGASRRQVAKHPLPPIRSLYYFLPLLEELRNEPHDPGYLAYLERRLRATLDG